MSREYMLSFPRLDGGLNLHELDYRMASDQSPEMKNLCWRDGVLSCRDGQVWLTEGEDLGTGYAAYDRMFRDTAFFHIGDGIYCMEPPDPSELVVLQKLTRLCGGVPENAGTFFRYGDHLYYKNRGGYLRIRYNGSGFAAEDVPAYVPVILINAHPATAAGDAYQPENRLCSRKTVWYSTVEGATEYHLPVQNVESIDNVVVDGVETTAYTVDLTKGIVTFSTEPKHHDPVVANTVRITYTKQNPDAMGSIMDCRYATVYGGNQNVCVVMGGCVAQPNAYFWSGSHAVMDPGYFPITQYNLAGAAAEAITGFGKQQDMLVIFKERSIGKANMGTVTMDNGRVLISMDYTAINDRIGCDLPGSIQLVQNNLVFANTQQGVHLLRDSSSAYENNIVCISRNVNGTDMRPGLLELVRQGLPCTSFDDDRSYWLVSGGDAYVWDYEISAYSEPSWFYHTNINGVAFLHRGETSYHMNAAGRITEFRRVFGDYDEPIEKVYRFATQAMGGYDRMKDITGVLFTVRSDTDTVVRIKYITDYEERYDLTPVLSYSWKLVPRFLQYRFVGVRKFATVARRKPGCRHVRHFTMRLENSEPASDLSIVSAQIFYKFKGRER